MDNHETSLDPWVQERLSESWEPQRPTDSKMALSQFRRRRNQLQKWRMTILRMAAALAVCLVTAASLPQTGVLAKKCVAACVTGAARLSRFVLSQAPQRPSEVLIAKQVRQAAPDFALPDQNGHIVRLSSLRGRVVLVNFWATWCKPCSTELPWFSDFQRQYNSQRLSMVAVAMDGAGWSVVGPFIAKQKVGFPVVIGGAAVADLYGGLDAVPTTLLIDKSGLVAVTNIGIQQREKYEAELKALLSER